MKKKNKLLRIVSVMLALALIVTASGVGSLTAYAANDETISGNDIVEDNSSEDTTEEKPSLWDRIVNFFTGGNDEPTTLEAGQGEPLVPVPEKNTVTKEELESMIEGDILYISKDSTSFLESEFSVDNNVNTILIDSELWGNVKKVQLYAKNDFTSGNNTSNKISIPDYAFYGCSNIEVVYGGASVESIGDFAFAECSSLYTINIADSTDVGDDAFILTNGVSTFDLNSSAPHTYVKYDNDSIDWSTTNRIVEWDTSNAEMTYTNTDGDEPKEEDFKITITMDIGQPGAYYPVVSDWTSAVKEHIVNRVLAPTEYTVSNTKEKNGWKTVITLNKLTDWPNGMPGQAAPDMPSSGVITAYESDDGKLSNTPFEDDASGIPDDGVHGDYGMLNIVYKDSSNNPMTGYYVVMDNWDTHATQMTEVGYIRIPMTDSQTHYLYFTNMKEKQTGEVKASQYNAAFKFSMPWHDGSSISTSNEDTKNGFKLNFDKVTGVNKNQAILTATCSGSPDEAYITIRGEYVDKNRKGLSNLYIVMDDWNTFYTKPNSDGTYSIPIPDEKNHLVYFTNKTTPGTGGIYNDDWFAYFRIWQNGSGQSITTTSKSNVVIEEPERKVTYTGSATVNVRTSNYEYTEVPTGPDDPNEPSKSYDGYITGEVVDTHRDGVSNMRLIITDSETNKQIGSVIRTDASGKYEIDLSKYNLVYGNTYRIYLMEKSWSGDGTKAIYNVDYIMYTTFQYNDSSKAVTMGNMYYFPTRYNKDDFTLDGTGTTSTHAVMNIVLGGTVDLGSGDPGTDDPTDDPVFSDVITVTGKYVDKNGTGIADKYIFVDVDTKKAVRANAAGVYSITISDQETHTISFTNLDTMPESGTLSQDDIVASIVFNGTKDEAQNLIPKITSNNLKTTKADGTATISGSTLRVNVTTKYINNDTEGGIGDLNLVLKNIKVMLDGSTSFDPYIGRVLKKEDFTVIAEYSYMKQNGADAPSEVQITRAVDTKDWTCDVLSDKGFTVTGQESTLIFKYTYNGYTATLPVTIKGVQEPVATINGTLLKKTDGDADDVGMSGYIVYLNDWDVNTVTDGAGKFSFEDVKTGTYKLYVTKSKKASSSVGEITSEPDCWYSTTVTVADGEAKISGTKNGDGVTSTSNNRNGALNLTIVYNPDNVFKLTIRGSYKSSTGSAVTDQYIVLDNWDKSTLATSDGSFTFSDITAGSHTLYFSNQKNKGSGSYSNSTNYAKVDIKITDDKVEATAVGYDGTTASADYKDGTLVIEVKLSQTSESKSTSDTLQNNTATMSAGGGAAIIKGTLQLPDNTPLSGAAVVIDDYSKAVDTSSTGSFEIQGVEDGQHTVVIHNVSKASLPSSGTVATSGDKVLGAFKIKVENGAITENDVINSDLNQYGFAKADDGKTLTLTAIAKEGTKINGTVTTDTNAESTTDSTDQAATGTTSLLPQTGLDYLENSGLLSGIARVVGEDSPIVKALTPRDTLASGDGNTVGRLGAAIFGEDANTGEAVLAVIIVILLVAGVGFGCVVLYKNKKERYNL